MPHLPLHALALFAALAQAPGEPQDGAADRAERELAATGPGWTLTGRGAVWLPALDAEATIGATSSGRVSKGHSDLFDDAEPGLTLAVEAAPEGGSFGWMLELTHLDVSAERPTRSVDVEQLFVEVDAFWRAPDLPGTDVFAGLRFGEVDVRAMGSGASASDDVFLIDPLVGARTSVPLGDEWSLRLRTDIGGFGIGTDITWQASAVASWALGPGRSIDLGWRYVDVDYADDFELDARYSGPTLGATLGF